MLTCSNSMVASSSSIMHDRNLARRNVINHMPRRNVVHVSRKIINEPSTIYHACDASFAICRKDRKVIARKLGAKCKGVLAFKGKGGRGCMMHKCKRGP
jgi:hypothetical protein